MRRPRSTRRVEPPWTVLGEMRRRHEGSPLLARAIARSPARHWRLHPEAWCNSDASVEPLQLTRRSASVSNPGILAVAQPDAVISMVAVNNLARLLARPYLARVTRVLERIREALPAARVLVLTILPAGERPSDEFRAEICAIYAAAPQIETPPE